MRDVTDYLLPSIFPRLKRNTLINLQVNLGYRCNQSCVHCHVNAGPNRTEMMNETTVKQLLDVIQAGNFSTLDLTGGAPELHPHFRTIVSLARSKKINVIDRCNLTVLLEDNQQDTAKFLADQEVEITASLPCYTKNNVDTQRGKGVFDDSIKALHMLNDLGYGRSEKLKLNLVYNPSGTSLPPEQKKLEADYKKRLQADFDIYFNHLFTITNMPIQRFGSTLLSKGSFEEYLTLLMRSHNEENLHNVMCKNTVSVDWQGYLYDCDFNQMLGMPLPVAHGKLHISELNTALLTGKEIATANHCYGCTAGAGSSCTGSLSDK